MEKQTTKVASVTLPALALLAVILGVRLVVRTVGDETARAGFLNSAQFAGNGHMERPILAPVEQ